MKTVKMKKSKVFSSKSRVYINIGHQKTYLKGFGLYAISVNPGDSIIASQLWTKSNCLNYDDIIDGSIFLIKPRMGRTFTLLVLFIFIICSCIFFLYKSRWSFVPIGIIAIYISLYLTILKNKYLIIEPIDNDST
jgi:hypothetical protein